MQSTGNEQLTQQIKFIRQKFDKTDTEEYQSDPEDENIEEKNEEIDPEELSDLKKLQSFLIKEFTLANKIQKSVIVPLAPKIPKISNRKQNLIQAPIPENKPTIRHDSEGDDIINPLQETLEMLHYKLPIKSIPIGVQSTRSDKKVKKVIVENKRQRSNSKLLFK